MAVHFISNGDIHFIDDMCSTLWDISQSVCLMWFCIQVPSPESSQVFTQPDPNQEAGQIASPVVITVNSLPRTTLLQLTHFLIHHSVYFSPCAPKAAGVSRSGRMNLFSLMQSISELDDLDKGCNQVNGFVELLCVMFTQLRAAVQMRLGRFRFNSCTQRET